MQASNQALIPAERIEQTILFIRGQKVMLDADLAKLYGVATKVLIQAVKRNARRFPPDFMFQLSKEELEHWRSQFVTSNPAAKLVEALERRSPGWRVPARTTPSESGEGRTA